MEPDLSLEELLKERQSICDKLTEQENTLMSLDAYKKTLIKCLCGSDFVICFPSELERNNQKSLVNVKEEYPLVIVNYGLLPASKTINSAIPNNFRSLRKFKRLGSENQFTWYTSTVYKKKNGYLYVIQDDENNTWQGIDAFADFSKSFNNKLPFRNVHEWLGLCSDEVKKHYNSVTIKPEGTSLDFFFQKSS